MRFGLGCLCASTLALAAACSSGAAPHRISAVGIVAADDPLLVPPELTERPEASGGAVGDTDASGARAFR